MSGYGTTAIYGAEHYKGEDDSPIYFSESIYFDFESTPKTDEIANEVIVRATPISFELSSSDVYSSTDEQIIPAAGSLDIVIKFDKAPVKLASVVTTLTDVIGVSNVTSEVYYAWGGYITVTGSAGNIFKLGSTGIKTEDQSIPAHVSDDSNSILEYGKQTYELEDNHLIQDIDTAKSIADGLVLNFKNVRQDVSIRWPGNLVVELADEVTCQEYKDDVLDIAGAFYIVRQNIEFNGALTVSTDLRRI